MSIANTAPSRPVSPHPPRFLVALFALGALLLCAVLMHAFGHGGRHEAAPATASVMHAEAAPGSPTTAVTSGHGEHPTAAHADGLSDPGVACGAGCGEHDMVQVICMLVFLTAGVFFLFVLSRRLATDHWFGAHELKIAVHARGAPRPMTPSPQELSISRT